MLASCATKNGNVSRSGQCIADKMLTLYVQAQLAEIEGARGIRQIVNCKPDWPRNGMLGELIDNPDWVKGLQPPNSQRLCHSPGTNGFLARAHSISYDCARAGWSARQALEARERTAEPNYPFSFFRRLPAPC